MPKNIYVYLTPCTKSVEALYYFKKSSVSINFVFVCLKKKYLCASKQSYGNQFRPWKQSYGSQFGPWLEQLIYPFFLSSFIQSATKLLSSTSIISIIGMDIIHYNEQQQHFCISWTIITSFTIHLVKKPISRRIITFPYISKNTYGIINILTCMDGFTRNSTYPILQKKQYICLLFICLAKCPLDESIK